MASLSVPRTTSASQLVSYAMCARKYACHYVHDLAPEFTSVPLIVGSVVHSGVEWWFGERLAGHRTTLDDAMEIVSADLAAATADVHVRWRDHTPESLEQQTRDLLHAYLTEHGNLPVAAIEQPFEVALEDPSGSGSTLPRLMRGYLDLVLEDDTVVELKTSAKAWPESFLERHLQLGAYAYVWNTLHGGPSRVQVHLLIKNKKPRIEVLSIERGELATRWWFGAVRAIEEAIQAGHFPPSPGPLCIECEYQRACARWDDVEANAKSPRSLPMAPAAPAHLFAF